MVFGAHRMLSGHTECCLGHTKCSFCNTENCFGQHKVLSGPHKMLPGPHRHVLRRHRMLSGLHKMVFGLYRMVFGAHTMLFGHSLTLIKEKDVFIHTLCIASITWMKSKVTVGDLNFLAFSNFTFETDPKDVLHKKHNVSHCGDTMVGQRYKVICGSV